MAGDWIKMRTNLAEDPAVIGIADDLQIVEDLVVGKLHRLWSWADSQSSDGYARSVTKKWIDRFLGVDGFADAMVKQRWLRLEKTGIRFPNFDRHNGKPAKERALSKRRMAKLRDADDTEMLRDERNESVTREEKRREEKKKQKKDQKPSSTSADVDPPENPETGKLNLTPPTPIGNRRERVRQITIDAITAFNAKLGKPNGLLPSVSTSVGLDNRIRQVERILKIAGEICQAQYGAPRITPEFWVAYWEEISSDEFKSGRSHGGNGHENWKPSFEYLTRPKVMLEVFDKAQSEDVA